MKAKEIDASIEQQICTYAITSSKFLRDVFTALKPDYLKSNYAKIVIKWVLEYYKEYHEAPGKHITDLYQKNAHLIKGEDDTELLSQFLINLSHQYENGDVAGDNDNIDFIVKNAILYLKLNSIDNLNKKLEVCLLNKDPVKAEQELGSFTRIETPRDKGVSLFDDTISVATAFIEEEDALFTFPGVLGQQVGSFVRGDLVAYLAASKRGKSWWELYTSQIAVYHGLRAVYFNLEMTDKQMLRRAWTSFSGRPRKRSPMQETRKIEIPSFSRDNEEDQWSVIFDSREIQTIDTLTIAKNQKDFRRQFRSGNLRIFSLPAYTATINDIQSYLDNLYYYDNFIPDVIVVDYADLIVPSNNYKGEYRHQIDEIWKSLRRLAQERNALVVTASQAGRNAFGADADEKDISEDIRKIAHVSKMISINQTKKERDLGIVRLQQLAERDDKSGGKKVIVLQCLDLGQVCVDSRLETDVNLDISEDPRNKN